jgi:hypothetical protein
MAAAIIVSVKTRTLWNGCIAFEDKQQVTQETEKSLRYLRLLLFNPLSRFNPRGRIFRRIRGRLELTRD